MPVDAPLVQASEGDDNYWTNAVDTRVSDLQPVNTGTMAVVRATSDAHATTSVTRPASSTLMNNSLPAAKPLPSVYSTSPVQFVKDSNSSNPAPHGPYAVGSTSPWSQSGRNPASHVTATQQDLPAPDAVILQLLDIFRQSMMDYNPAISLLDFEDTATLLSRHRNFVVCVAYVTARTVPGGSAIRDRLLPCVINLVQSLVTEHLPNDTEEGLKTLQGLLLLYAYCEIPSATQYRDSQADPAQEPLFWPLKSLIESYAQRLRCHRAVDSLRESIRARQDGIATSTDFKMYSAWVWLFTMSHYISLVTATPPSIRADASLRAASRILRQLDQSARVQCLAAELDIALIWEDLRGQGYDIAEWWCLPEIATDYATGPRQNVSRIALERLDDLGSRLSSTTSDSFNGVRVDYHVRFARFCIQSYEVRNATAAEPPAPMNIKAQAIRNCLEAAMAIVDWILAVDLGKRDSLRFASDSSHIMTALCCLFTLQSLQTFSALGLSLADAKHRLAKVREVAEIEMGIFFVNHGPYHYFKHTIEYAGTIEQALNVAVSKDLTHDSDGRRPSEVSTLPSPADNLTTISETAWFPYVDSDDFYLFENLWDPSTIFPVESLNRTTHARTVRPVASGW
ncbi:uncharacterized protein AB675_1767 [Cyphellophora attinorum]|uniref:Transcription factor domain-containing protein n=1 Tax=Cyphellophora attinorum TaxID=1664694 RepID=A0A0N1HD70_9EURO|nr:uncharacterized protein AB675_1767 [Phialophora attinorum]KPI42863.1 hypothetical protein AB675_1767 [Phialophora attinorum]